MYTVGNDIVSTVATQIDIIIIGKLLGTEVLGTYSIIKELILRPTQLINPIVTKVSFPIMSKINDDIVQV
jgi:O-antigen/teichoic acid export membrane protein